MHRASHSPRSAKVNQSAKVNPSAKVNQKAKTARVLRQVWETWEPERPELLSRLRPKKEGHGYASR